MTSAPPTLTGIKRSLADDNKFADDVTSELVNLTDGLDYQWTRHVGEESIKYHGAELKLKFHGTTGGSESFDWESTPGYLCFGPKGGEPLFERKIIDGVRWLGGMSYSSSGFGGGSRSFTYKTSFAIEPGTSLDNGVLGPPLEGAAKTAADNIRRATANHAKAFAAFLDAGGKRAFDLVVTNTDASNKATYVDLTATTAGGSVFELNSRLGGQFISQNRVISGLGRDPSFLQQLAGLTEMPTFYSRVVKIRLVTKGSDLDLDHEGFAVRYKKAAGTVKYEQRKRGWEQ